MGAHSTDVRAFLFSNPMGDAPSLAQSELLVCFWTLTRKLRSASTPG